MHFYRRRLLAMVLCALGLSLGCGGGEENPPRLLLEITSDAPTSGATLTSLRLLFVKDGVTVPVDETDAAFNIAVGPLLNPVDRPVEFDVANGGTAFPDGIATAHITGRVGGLVATVWSGEVDLNKATVFKIRLRAIQETCDGDGDGFMDCSQTGCCAPGEEGLGDCDPVNAEARPWGIEDACEPCADTLDQDCDGADVACVDTDQDGIEDCNAELDCDPADGAVGVGLPELCDGKDNDCDGATDEGFVVVENGQPRRPGDACGTGVCAGGTVVCETGSQVSCDSLVNAVTEACGDSVDNDCDGSTDEGCVAGDRDGDGVTTDGGDCNDFDSGVYPGAPEGCCPPDRMGDAAAEARCDTNCDMTTTFCDAADLDFDGFTPADGDCDDTDPLTYPNAPEKCGDGKDQDCVGGDVACSGAFADLDGDGWKAPEDCDDRNAAINPEAIEICDGVDNDCDGAVDDGNPETNGSANCGSEEGECDFGTLVCVNGGAVRGEVQCVDFIGPAPDICDEKDNDCNGTTDDGYVDGSTATYTDLNGTTGLTKGASCGSGACSGGMVVCAAGGVGLTCTTAGQASADTCDGADNDCDGATDEDFSSGGVNGYAERDGSGTLFLGDNCGLGACFQDSSSVRGSVVCSGDGTRAVCSTGGQATADLCDSVDNDCDGATDEDFTNGAVTYTDTDGTPNLVKGGACGIGACGTGVVVCSADAITLTCSSLTNRRAEVCDNLDNDCDGSTDEDYAAGGTFKFTDFDGTAGKVKGAPCGVGACDLSGFVQCDLATGGLMCGTNVGARITPAPEICDNVDNDCDGDIDEDFKSGGTTPYRNWNGSAFVDTFLSDGCGVGACAGGTVQCNDDTRQPYCETAAGAAILPTPETCDAVDNDCDGLTDEDFRPVADAPTGREGEYQKVDFSDFEGSTRYLGDACGDEGVCAAGDGEVSCSTRGTLYCAITSGTNAGDAVTPIAEVCDDLDNDCDGVTDEPFRDDAPDGLSMTPYRDLQDVGAGVFALVDVYKGGSCGLGACGGGTVVCDASSGTPFCEKGNAAVDPQPEICDGIDNDCDGLTDEDFRRINVQGGEGDFSFADYDGRTRFLGENCGIEGVCAASGGLVQCNAGGGLYCEAQNNWTFGDDGDEVIPQTEVCDGGSVDEDCDGQADEDFRDDGVAPGAMSSPYLDFDGNASGTFSERFLGASCGLGECSSAATVQCNASTGRLHCADMSGDTVRPVPEICDDLDNDCDGDTDDNTALAAGQDTALRAAGCRTAGVCDGVVSATCSSGTYVCSYDTGGVPNYAADESGTTAGAMGRCDDLDNDCDGSTDEDLVVNNAASNAMVTAAGCDTDGVCGELGETVATCNTGASSGWSCQYNDASFEGLGATDETLCDGKDNDCDGSSDEPFRLGTQNTTNYRPIGGAANGVDDLVLDDTCGRGACGTGAVICGSDGVSLACTTDGNAVAETCDNVDNDCDGDTDDSDATAIGAGADARLQAAGCKTVGVCLDVVTASCSAGVYTCSYDTGGVTNYASTEQGTDQAAASRCDNLDNDCDGGTDEDILLTNTSGTAGLPTGHACRVAGVCAPAGMVRARCTDGAQASAANKFACEYLSADFETQETRCDAQDNDCLGDTDEAAGGGTIMIAAGQNAALQAAGCRTVGVCTNATSATCSASTPGEPDWTCNNPTAFRSTEEGDRTLCNDLDDDCDGTTDEDIRIVGTTGADRTDLNNLASCPALSGVCMNAGSTAARCNVGSSAGWTCEFLDPAYQATETKCDGLDNDCNGIPDEPAKVDLGTGDTERLIEVGCRVQGICSGVTTAECTAVAGSGTAAWTCDYPAAYVADEAGTDAAAAARCNGDDDDCDGQVDDGIVGTTSALISAGSCLTGGVCTGATSVACVGGNLSCSYTASTYQAVETKCDGLNNDCDAMVDEDAGGSTIAIAATDTAGLVGAGCRVAGICDGVTTATCNAVADSGTPAWTCNNPGAYVDDEAFASAGSAALCNGDDDDCDGAVDDGFSGTTAGLISAASCRTGGVCAGATSVRCTSGSLACDYTATTFQSVETACDGLDNDCDGTRDEAADVNIPAGENTRLAQAGCPTQGICAGVTTADCNAANDAGAPSWDCQPPLSLGYVADESGNDLDAGARCNNKDDDCDGATDEGIGGNSATVVAGIMYANCDTDGVCGTGGSTATCTAGSWSCAYGSAVYEDTSESRCDNLDNDCDGSTDETLAGAALTATGAAVGCPSAGVCSSIGATCTSGMWACDFPTSHAPVEEGTDAAAVARCDGDDNDCDGTADEISGNSSEIVTAAGCLTAGLCGSGLAAARCIGPSMWSCDYLDGRVNLTPGNDTCDGLDSDCDSSVDEDHSGSQCDANADSCATAVQACTAGVLDCGDQPTACSGGTLACADADATTEPDLCGGCTMDSECGTGYSCAANDGGSYCALSCTQASDCTDVLGGNWTCDAAYQRCATFVVAVGGGGIPVARQVIKEWHADRDQPIIPTKVA